MVFRKLLRTVLGNYSNKVLLSTEMISSKGITYTDNPHRMRLTEEERDNVLIQLFGHEPETMAKAARIAEKAGACGIDINMGCPVPKIVNGKDGAALMKEPDLAINIVKEVISSVNIPVSVKTRLGWSEKEKNIKEFALRLQDAGIKFLTIHGRTRSQGYTGNANWQDISEVVELLDIPVFTNGDIDCPEKAILALNTTKSHGIACARGVIGNPWLLLNIIKTIYKQDYHDEVSFIDKIKVLELHADMSFEDKGEVGVTALKRHFSKYISNHKQASLWRQKFALAKNYKEVKNIIDLLRNRN